MIILINRTNPKGEYLDGKLSIDGAYVCDTTENAYSCIPAGIYTIDRRRCKQHEQERYVPVVMVDSIEPPCNLCRKLNFVCYDTIMPCRCPQIKVGNGTHNLHDGRILVGERLVTGVLQHSITSYTLISERIRKCISRGKSVTLIVKDYEK